MIDPEDIEKLILSKNLFSNNLSITSNETILNNLYAKVEAQKWCLGLDGDLSFYSDVSGVLQRIPQPGTVDPNVYSEIPETDNVKRDYIPGKPNQSGFVLLPARGPGWMSNEGTPDSQRWGVPKLIEALVVVAAEWKRRGNTMPLVYGDISLRYGGHFPPHVSHREGIDVDIRPIGYKPGRSFYGGTNYNRAKTRELIKLIINNGVLPVGMANNKIQIGFQDPVLVGEGLTLDWSGHKDHFHVRFTK
jgi:hypothetical protein